MNSSRNPQQNGKVWDASMTSCVTPLAEILGQLPLFARSDVDLSDRPPVCTTCHKFLEETYCPICGKGLCAMCCDLNACTH